MSTVTLIRGTVATLLALLFVSISAVAADFERDVEPILHQRCYLCHGSQQQMSGLRLDSRESAFESRESGFAVVPGDPESSGLIRRIESAEDGFRMPPGDDPLSPTDRATLRAWIAAGADWPDRLASPVERVAGRVATESHWAFQSVIRPELPSVQRDEWVRNPIDRFVLAKLESEGLAPAPEAPQHTLLRRVHFDLTGLPPTDAELDGLESGGGASSYEAVVDDLLRSPHFGERWALPWLDLARYADSDGYERDPLRPHAWRWRHWVIDALNRDMPYDRFTVEQIAGDLLPSATVEQRVATGFLRNGIKNREAGTKNAQKRFEETVDRLNTVANAWLGLTVGCAQCHDHKYDPLSQREFYALFAFFHNAVERDVEAPLPGELGPHLRTARAFREGWDVIRERHGIPALQAAWREQMLAAMDEPGVRTDWDHSVTEWRAANDRADWLLRSGESELTDLERQKIADWFLRSSGPDFGKDEGIQERIKKARDAISALRESGFAVSRAYTMVERREPVPARIALRGDYTALGSEVPPGVPGVLPALRTESKPSRLALAEWIASDRNPLTARVEVNRIWQELFGRGLVETPDNFGTQGKPPSHPELLDWLASEFVSAGWSRKKLVRLIVTSSTYRQSSADRADVAERDPGNAWLARQNRLRLPAELIRDNALTVSGLLKPTVGGKSVFPPQPSGVSELSYSKKDWDEDLGPDRYRRGLYVFLRRTSPYPMLVNFDAPDTLSSVSRRERSNTPLQALNLLNDPVFLEAADALAYRILQSPAGQFEDRFESLIRRCLTRSPADSETERAKLFHGAQLERFGALGSEAERFAWREVSRAVLSLDEFITRE